MADPQPPDLDNVDLIELNVWQHGQHTVGTTAVQLDATPLTKRRVIRLKANAGNTVAIYIGKDNTVTTGTGYPLRPGEAEDFEFGVGATIWAIASAASQLLFRLESGI